MARIHPSAVIEGEVELADDVEVGPGCVIRGPVRIGAGTRLIGQCWIEGPTTLGAANVVYPNASIGFAPQSVSYDPKHPGKGVVIGDRNVLREGVTIHRAMTEAGPTTLGDDNFFMTCSHAGHDCRIGSRCIVATGAAFGGHAVVGDRVVVGGVTAIHQFVRLGEGAMLTGATGVSRDVPPWFMVTGLNIAGAVNVVGMRRAGFDSAQIDAVRWAHRVICRAGLTTARIVERLRERGDEPLIAGYLAFIGSGSRKLCMARGRASRGQA